MMKTYLLTINIFLAVLSEYYSVYYAHRNSSDVHPFAAVMCVLALHLLLPAKLQDTEYLLLPYLYLASVTDIRCGEIPYVSILGILCLLPYPFHLSLSGILFTLLLTVPASVKEYLGWGDTQLLLVMSAAYGDRITWVLLIASVSALFIQMMKKKKDTILRFGPYLSFAFYLMLFFH